VVIKGSARGGPGQLAAHLQRTDTNERMRVVELRVVVADDLDGALDEMDALGAGLRTRRTLYHASINTRADEPMTDEQWTIAIDRLEAKLGLTGQPRAVVEHEKEGREHVHIVWSRADLEHMRAIRADHNFRQHEETARELEREFGHARVQGAHAERDGEERPERTPSHAEMQQAARTGLSPQEAKEQITELWQRTDSGQSFAAALDDAGWILARGDRRDFLVVDPHGEAHSLARRVEGTKAADVRARMADIDRETLPSAEEARERQEQRQAAKERGSPAGPGIRTDEPAPPQPTPPVTSELVPNDSGRGIEHSSPPRDNGPDEPFMQTPLHVENVPPPAPAPRQAAHNAGQSPALSGGDSFLSFGFDLLSETLHNTIYVAQETGREIRYVAGELGRQGDSTGPEEKLTDFVDRELDRRGEEPPPKEFSAAELATDSAARREHYAQQQGERDRNVALDRMGEDIKAGNNLKPEHVRALSREDLAGIKAEGDGYLRSLASAREQELHNSRESRDRERER
jgi:hypothetical protein